MKIKEGWKERNQVAAGPQSNSKWRIIQSIFYNKNSSRSQDSLKYWSKLRDFWNYIKRRNKNQLQQVNVRKHQGCSLYILQINIHCNNYNLFTSLQFFLYSAVDANYHRLDLPGKRSKYWNENSLAGGKERFLHTRYQSFRFWVSIILEDVKILKESSMFA